MNIKVDAPKPEKVDKRNNVRLPDTFKIIEFLEDILEQGEFGYWSYKDKWDDERVAVEMAARLKIKCTHSNIVTIRSQMFGKMRPGAFAAPAAPPSNADQLAARLDNLEARVARSAQNWDATLQNFETRLVELEKNLIFARHLSATRIAGRVDELEVLVREHKVELGKMKLKTKFG
jgi:HD superfamily phosphodiesterase